VLSHARGGKIDMLKCEYSLCKIIIHVYAGCFDDLLLGIGACARSASDAGREIALHGVNGSS